MVDIGLPTIDGYEVARHVRSHLNGSVRLVALTGYGRPQDRQMIDPPALARVMGSVTARNSGAGVAAK